MSALVPDLLKKLGFLSEQKLLPDKTTGPELDELASLSGVERTPGTVFDLKVSIPHGEGYKAQREWIPLKLPEKPLRLHAEADLGREWTTIKDPKPRFGFGHFGIADLDLGVPYSTFEREHRQHNEARRLAEIKRADVRNKWRALIEVASVRGVMPIRFAYVHGFGADQVKITMTVPPVLATPGLSDPANAGEPFEIFRHVALPRGWFGEDHAKRWLLDEARWMFRHECDEQFHIGEDRPFVPHHEH